MNDVFTQPQGLIGERSNEPQCSSYCLDLAIGVSALCCPLSVSLARNFNVPDIGCHTVTLTRFHDVGRPDASCLREFAERRNNVQYDAADLAQTS